MVSGKRSRAPSFSGDANTRPESPETGCSHRLADFCQDVVSISSPDFSRETEKHYGQLQIGNFLDHCRFCRKKLHNCDVFMYGCFGAFCSPECREKQMAYDKLMYLCKNVRAKKGRSSGNKAK